MRDYLQYDVVVRKGHETATGTGTRKREAIRVVRRLLRGRPGAKGEVRERPADKKRGTLIYQAHTNDDGKIIAEEL
jgi:hypothetical protein